MSPADNRASAFCSVCCADIIGEVVREPLGRLGALVAVCLDCRTTTPTASYGRRGYEAPPEGAPLTPERLAEQKRLYQHRKPAIAERRARKRSINGGGR